jgi:hypothetical protein
VFRVLDLVVILLVPSTLRGGSLYTPLPLSSSLVHYRSTGAQTTIAAPLLHRDQSFVIVAYSNTLRPILQANWLPVHH